MENENAVGVGGVPPDRAKPKAAFVREYFPETLYWNPQLITDEKGHARLELPMADSITTWRMLTSAVSAKGELGSDSRGIRCFQDFFVDIDFPVFLTQDDEVEVPVAVYNYLKEPQDVELKVEKQDWFELVSPAVQNVRLEGNSVAGAKVRVKVKKIGVQSLTVHASGSKGLADAIRRTVEVLPNGYPVETAKSDWLKGRVEQKCVIPPEAIEGADSLVLRVYPGRFSEIMGGLEGLVRLPHG